MQEDCPTVKTKIDKVNPFDRDVYHKFDLLIFLIKNFYLIIESIIFINYKFKRIIYFIFKDFILIDITNYVKFLFTRVLKLRGFEIVTSH